MREGWTYKKLGEITKVINGLWIGKKPPLKTVAVIRNTNFTKDCKLSTTNIAYIDVEEKQFEKKRLLQGDIIIEKSGGSEKQPVGRPILFNLIGGEFSFSNFTSVIRIDNPNEIISPFLHLALYGAYLRGETLKMQAKTTGIHNLDFKAYNRILIPIPSLQEQQQIVSELDLLSSVIEKQKAQIEELDKLAQSIFYDMFGDPVENEKGWEVKKLVQVSSKITNGNTPKGGSDVYIDEGILFFRSQNVWRNRIDLDDIAYIDEETHKKLHNSSLMHNDILITKTGRFNTENSSLGRASLYEGTDNEANINGHVYLVRLKSGMIHKFVLYILISNSFRDLIRRVCVGGIDKRQLNKNHIEDFPIIIPPLSLQQEFADKIEAIESMKAKVRQSLKESETLFNSRMDFYFS